MGKLTGKIVEAKAIPNARGSASVGPELRRLRLLAGLTQKQIADRLDVQQAAISKIEKGGEIYLSTVQRYVEALGASLRLNAHFPVDAPISARLDGAFDVDQGSEDQLVLPLLGDEPFKTQRGRRSFNQAGLFGENPGRSQNGRVAASLPGVCTEWDIGIYILDIPRESHGWDGVNS